MTSQVNNDISMPVCASGERVEFAIAENVAVVGSPPTNELLLLLFVL